MKTLFQEHEAIPGERSWQCLWIITAPWAHPWWSQYAVALFDLTTPIDAIGHPKIHLFGATHEVWVFALNPKYPITDEVVPKGLHRLEPANHVYQFRANSDAEARERVQEIVDRINRMELSPDTDFRRVWDGIFGDGVSLYRKPEPDWVQAASSVKQ